jgi:hypothetical protein
MRVHLVLTQGQMTKFACCTAVRTSGKRTSSLLSCKLLRRMVPLKPIDLQMSQHSTARHGMGSTARHGTGSTDG